ncbi:helix-turn-helix transcriptional regulator [Lachnoclostridium sp. An118]|uniref:helix-turn-helix transcriptional regulator n=1 Tax=Lachnoclostridium sp. An118 TaxID=1965547 RepID=UPI0013A60E4D|nr:YafY family protein [Lachnoclostridium sp. An118]
MKNARLLEILLILLEKRKTTSIELASHFEVSVRTIYRDIDLLSQIGIPLYTSTGKNGGIFLMDGFSVDKTLLLKEEQQNLFSVLQSIDSIPGVDINSIKQKFAALYAFNQSQSKDEWLDINLTGWLSDPALFEKIRKAIIEKDRIEFIYTNVRGEEQKRIVEPRKLTFRYRTWYLYGFCHLRNDYRMFKVSRIRELNVLQEKFEDRPYTLPPIYTNTAAENQIDLTLDFSIQAAPYIYDLFGDKDISRISDNKIRLSMKHVDEEWLYHCLMFFGDQVTVIAPDCVKKELRERHKAAYKKMDAGT